MSDIDRMREAESASRSIAREIARIIPEGWLFTLNLFDTKSGGSLYISNAEPADVPKALRECADRIEEREKKSTPRGM